MNPPPASKLRVLLVTLALVGVTFALYWPVRGHDFTGIDDPDYVTENIHVKNGLTRESIAWAFRSKEASNWHPLTWLSHMADCQLFGLKAGVHHLVNVGFHAANAVLLACTAGMLPLGLLPQILRWVESAAAAGF